MDEFGETPTFYIWPKDHVEGEPFPDDFYKRVAEALHIFGLEGEVA
jgi:hypothetical protein